MINGKVKQLYQCGEAPIKDSKMRKGILRIIIFILKNQLEAMRLFYIEKAFECFDPHVGDTSCQVRALQVSDASFYLHGENLMRELKLIKEALVRVEEEYIMLDSMEKIRNGSISIYEYLHKFGVTSYLDDKNKLLAVMWILTKYKVSNDSGEIHIDIDHIIQDSKLSRKVCKKLVRHYQLIIAEASCNDIVAYAKHCGFHSEYITLLINSIQRDDDGRSVLPCFFQMEVINAYMKEKHRVWCMIIDFIECGETKARKRLYFIGSSYVEKSSLKESEINNSFCIHGTASLAKYGRQEDTVLKSIRKFGISEVMLMCMASHPQYSGHRLIELNNNVFAHKNISNIYEKNKMAKMAKYRANAEIYGCSIQNPTLFVVKHIFCGQKIVYNYNNALKKEVVSSYEKQPRNIQQQERWPDVAAN